MIYQSPYLVSRSGCSKLVECRGHRDLVNKVAASWSAIEPRKAIEDFLAVTMLLRPSQRGPLGQSLVARRPLDVGRNAEGPWRLEGFELANQGWNGRAKIEELSRRRMFQNFQWTFVYHILMKVPEVLVKFEKGEVERGSRSYYKGRELKRGHGFCLWSRFDVTKSVAWASAPAPLCVRHHKITPHQAIFRQPRNNFTHITATTISIPSRRASKTFGKQDLSCEFSINCKPHKVGTNLNPARPPDASSTASTPQIYSHNGEQSP